MRRFCSYASQLDFLKLRDCESPPLSSGSSRKRSEGHPDLDCLEAMSLNPGADGGNRTHDLFLTKEVLYP